MMLSFTSSRRFVAILALSGCIGLGSASPAAPQPDAAAPAAEIWASPAALAALPQAPEKALVIQHCAVCHALDRLVAAGGTEEGWANRMNRMIRFGATIPRDQIPAVAAYLAKTLPPRPAPPEGR